MNHPIKGLDGLDAFLNGDDVNFDGLSNNTAYYTLPSVAHVTLTASMAEAGKADVASTASAVPAASTADMLQNVNAGESLINMIGLSDLIYSNGGLLTKGTLPPKNATVIVNGTTYTVLAESDPNDSSGYQGLILYDLLSKSIIVVNKGTQTAQNWATDAVMATENINNQWPSAYALASQVAGFATALKVTSIYTTGHSLGMV